MPIKIVTDSTADISQEEIERYNITVLPLTISIDGQTFIDRVDITPSEFILKMRQAKDLPKSSQPSFGAFTEIYNQLTEDGSEVISIHLSSGLSGTYQTARGAAEQAIGKVTVVDSQFISKALTYQVIEAAKLAEQGMAIDGILKRLEEIKNNTKLYVVVDTLENLEKGGRIGKGKALIGSLLKIKPIAALEEGVYSPIATVRSYSQVAKHLVKQLKSDVNGKIIKKISLVHADGKELATQLKEKILGVYDYLDIKIEDTTPIISTHTGPGAIGFMYYAE